MGAQQLRGHTKGQAHGTAVGGAVDLEPASRVVQPDDTAPGV
jgi:hypothetical protein